MTEPQITVNGTLAGARNEFSIIFVVFRNPNIPTIYYAGGWSDFSLKKIGGEWKITRWHQHELPEEILSAKMQADREGKEVNELIDDLGSPNLRKWALAMSDLRKMRNQVVDQLLEALNKGDNIVKKHIAQILSDTRDEKAVEALTKTMANGEIDVSVRKVVVGALSECDGHIVDDALFAVVRDGEFELRAAASLALARRLRQKTDEIYRIARRGIRSEDESIRRTSAETLGFMISLRGADFLIQRLMDKNELEEVRLASLEALKGLASEPVLQKFREILKDKSESERIRAQTARALGAMKDRRSVDMLIDLSKSKKQPVEVRRETIMALGKIGEPKAAKHLIGLLKNSDIVIRRSAANSLEKLGERRALKPLLMVLMDREEDITVRRLAGRGIVNIDRSIAFGPLVEIMNDETENAPARRNTGDPRSLWLVDRLGATETFLPQSLGNS